MTPAQLEAAARELCRIRGYDPDAKPDYPLIPMGGATWEQFADEIRSFVQIGTAIAATMNLPPVKRAAKRKKT